MQGKNFITEKKVENTESTKEEHVPIVMTEIYQTIEQGKMTTDGNDENDLTSQTLEGQSPTSTNQPPQASTHWRDEVQPRFWDDVSGGVGHASADPNSGCRQS